MANKTTPAAAPKFGTPEWRAKYMKKGKGAPKAAAKVAPAAPVKPAAKKAIAKPARKAPAKSAAPHRTTIARKKSSDKAFMQKFDKARRKVYGLGPNLSGSTPGVH